MPTQTIDMNNVTSVSFNNQTVNEIKLNGNTIWPQTHNTYIYFDDDYSSQFTLTTANSTKNWDGTIETSTDGTNWTVWDGTTGVTSSNNGRLYVRGSNNTYITGNKNNGWVFTNAHLIAIGGNIESLLDNETVGANTHPSMANYAFAGLFMNAPIFLVPETFLPATTLAKYCYQYLFSGTNLLIAPALPATILADYCYQYLFNGCTALSDIDDLHLNANTVYIGSYSNMFKGCTALTTAPALPATTVRSMGCAAMFYGCTALVTPPALPATTVDTYSYNNIFYGCTSLTKLVALPAINISSNSYAGMFRNCPLIGLSTTQSGDYVNEYRIPTTGTGTATTNSFSNMFSGTHGSFTSNPTVNTTYYTWNTIVS